MTVKYDFTTIMDRRGHDALAVDAIGRRPDAMPLPREGFDIIPMWVADMNFPVAPPIIEAIHARVDHPSFGYFFPREEYFSSIIDWHKKRYGVEDLEKEHIGYENGVLGGVVSALNVLCSKGDKVLVHSPTYIGFTGSLENNGYKLIHSPLVQDENGVYRMDLADMEEKIITHKIHAAVFCSPHNPTGRMWEREELEAAMALFAKHDVYVVSDEIWAGITLHGKRHIPLQSVSADARERTIAIYAPSKTFNLAGLIGSYHVIYNKRLRERVEKESSLCHYNDMNVLSMHALIGAYGEAGQQWADELCEVISQNVDYACAYIKAHFSGIRVAKPEGTYMLFLDCSEWCEKNASSLDALLRAGWEVGVYWQDGRPFHGKCHIRMNLALPLSRVQEALDRLDKYVFNV